VGARGGHDVMQVFVLALDLAENRVEGMLERAVNLVTLFCLQLLEIAVNALARLNAALTKPAAKILDDLLAR
jgi:hypothetical protein